MSKKITFTLPAQTVNGATSGVLLGDFNGWDEKKGIPLKKQKDGSLQTTVALEPGATYHYRYLLNDGRWANDENAEHYVYDYNVENCVITVPADIKTNTAKVASKKASLDEAATEKEKTIKAKPAKKSLK